MEILIATAVSLLTEGFKWLSKKLGIQKSRILLVSVVFVLSFVYAMLKYQGIITGEIIAKVIELGTMSVGIYELIYKRVLKQVIESK